MAQELNGTPEVRVSEGGTIGEKRISGVAFWVTFAFGLAGILLNVHQIWNIGLFGIVMVDTAYLYLLLALFLPLAYLAYPARPADAGHIPWYDWILFVVACGAGLYMSAHGSQIVLEGWDIVAPLDATLIGAVLVVLALEATRRAGGVPLFIICTVAMLYPLFSENMAGFLWGPSMDLPSLARAHSMGSESLIGLPVRVTGDLLLGFLIFGSALVVTGGGEFFMAFATSLMGRSRGGPAKVAILSSGFFGSLSGSVISNVVTTGQITIPTMKRIGYPATYAGAVEACASTGGALMPPVMGAVAFIMAEFLNVPYSTIIVAAALPAILYYLALLLQADNYAARRGLKGLPAEEIPPLLPVLKGGWHFLFSLGVLIYMLLFMRIEAYAPYYATIMMLATAALRRHNRFGLRGLRELVIEATKTIVNIIAIVVGIGMILGSLSYTGVGGAFSRELLQYAGDSVFLLLVLGALTSFLLGMGMTVTACYIFLAVVLAPALTEVGLDPVASHLFILYWGMISYITPPVALASITAASIAGSNPLNTGFMSMRLGLIIMILPFIFVIHPTLILHGSLPDIIHDTTAAVVAIWLMASAFEGWLYGVGKLGVPVRVLTLIAAGVLLYPEFYSDMAGLALLAAIYAYSLLRKRIAAPAQ